MPAAAATDRDAAPGAASHALHWGAMSKIPKPARRPAPKDIANRQDHDSFAHDELLRLCWQRAAAIAASVLAVTPASLRTSLRAEEARYRHALRKASGLLARWREEGGLPRTASSRLRALLAELERRHASDLPEPELQDIGPVAIVSRTLALPFFERTMRGEPAAREAGFIDLAIAAMQPDSLRIHPGLPMVLQDFSFASGDTAGRIAEIDPGDFRAPRWAVDTVERTVWIDIRPELPPAGLLLRELKVLRQHAPEDAAICIVSDSDDAMLRAMLANEGFRLLSRGWLEDIGPDT